MDTSRKGDVFGMEEVEVGLSLYLLWVIAKDVRYGIGRKVDYSIILKAFKMIPSAEETEGLEKTSSKAYW